MVHNKEVDRKSSYILHDSNFEKILAEDLFLKDIAIFLPV